MKKMIPGLDVLRFLLACYLVLYHTLPYYAEADTMPLGQVFRLGGCATSIFFILSGFILSHVYVGTTRGENIKISPSRFFINRFTNLYPIHIITLLLAIAVMAVTSRPYDVYMSMVDSAPAIMHTMSTAEVAVNSVLQVLLLQAWNPFYLAFNIPAWSFSTLLFFYLFFPILAPRLISMRRKWTMLIAMWAACLLPAIITVANGWYGAWTIGTLHTNPLLRLPEFLAGILAYGIFAGHAEQITGFVARHRRIVILTLAAFYIGAAYLFADGPQSWKVLLHNGAILPAQIALIFVSASVLQGASPRAAGWARRLGNASLSIFALQIPLFTLFLKVQKALDIPYPLLSCFHRFHLCKDAARIVPLHFSAYPAYLVMILFASVLFQEKVIAPLREPLRRMLTRRWGPPLPPNMLSPSAPRTWQEVVLGATQDHTTSKT
ncbi:peptidoglycan/LPS O-acetylase OafA/YrhL [Paraburkholderia sp. RAU2J]|uniref:acyltransferase family protein n=1 Tax=Paraburkholderia sp. RAU2J TaxID=1938810 RepID=UPI000EAE64DE|nr:acyltransferase [Paraburkholderia sp. RAU2J]RKT20467.1 peptidoglycan/LPS O-acetylase OafA/YrhL [Paraburkholderia sp. RAU2J]